MKLMFTVCCSSVVVPNRDNKIATFCHCKLSACWWIDGAVGTFALYNGMADINQVYGIGLHNSFLTAPVGERGLVDKETIEKIINETPDYYLFKRLSSCILKFRPGVTSDTFFFTEVPEDVRC